MYLCANLSMMFTELPMVDRFAAARDAGFDGVEIQFPDEEDMGALARARVEAGFPVALINVPRGGPDQAGLAALPGREADFAAAVETCRRNAEALGAEKVNILAGFTRDAPHEACADTLTRNLRHAAGAFAGDGRRVMVEPVNPRDVPGFFLHGLDAGLAALERAGHPNLFLQFDLYHMAITEADLLAAIARAGPHIGHVQFADAPGRHEPGTGGIDFVAALAALAATGYDGAVSAEYRPLGDTLAGLAWVHRFKRALA